MTMAEQPDVFLADQVSYWKQCTKPSDIKFIIQKVQIVDKLAMIIQPKALLYMKCLPLQILEDTAFIAKIM